MNRHQVLFINDSAPIDSELERIVSELSREFRDLGETFGVEWRLTNLLSQSIDAIVSELISSSPSRDVLLIDANMPNYRDGVRLINSLRRSGYAGFTYLWSAANLSDELKAFPSMLKQVGSGGFMSGQEAALALQVRADWEACGRTFQVGDPTKMSLTPPEELALQILSEFLTGCLLSESNSSDPENWKNACSQASSLFKEAPGNFESVVSSFPDYDESRLDEAACSIELLRKTESNNHGVIFKTLERLRDSLLAVAKSCEDAVEFRV